MTPKRRALHASPFNSPVAALLADDDAVPSTELHLAAAPREEEGTLLEQEDAIKPPATARRTSSRKVPPNRTGTRTAPYARKDGVETVKIAFSASADFDARLRVFIGGLPPSVTRNSWIEQALSKAMAKEQR